MVRNYSKIWCVRLRHTCIGSALNGQKSYKIYSKSSRILGEAPDGTSLYVGALRAEIIQKLNSKLIALRAEIIFAYACGILYIGVP